MEVKATLSAEEVLKIVQAEMLSRGMVITKPAAVITQIHDEVAFEGISFTLALPARIVG